MDEVTARDYGYSPARLASIYQAFWKSSFSTGKGNRSGVSWSGAGVIPPSFCAFTAPSLANYKVFKDNARQYHVFSGLVFQLNNLYLHSFTNRMAFTVDMFGL